nr:immunoglobulin heavy chain junction region [Macaca mulatta]
CTRGECW